MEDFAQIHTAVDDLTSAFTGFRDRYDRRLADIEAAQNKMGLRLNRPALGGMDRSAGDQFETRTFAKWLRHGSDRLTAEEAKSLQVVPAPSGGYLAPDQFVRELLRNVVLFSPIRSVCRVQEISAGAAILPKRTGGMTASWVPEVGPRPETTVTFGQNLYPVCELAAYIDVSNQLLDDAAFDIASEVSFEFGEEFGRSESASFVNGSGTLQPQGLMQPGLLNYTPTGDASKITCDALISLFHAVAPAYRVNGVWAMNSSSLASVRQLKTATVQGVQGAPANTLLGKPVIECPDLPDIAGGAFPVVFGDWGQGYRIFDRIALSVLRDPFTRASEGWTRFHARRRVAGGVGKPEALRKLKISAS